MISLIRCFIENMREHDKGMNRSKERQKGTGMRKERLRVEFQQASPAIISNPQKINEQELQECQH
jgi:hypothetical protein